MISVSNKSIISRRDSSIYTFRAHSAEDNIPQHNQMRKNKLSQQLTGFKQKVSVIFKKYSKLHDQIQNDIPNNSFFFSLNKWHKEKIDSIKDDPQIISAKLKFLQNRAQIGRADMELNQREHSRKKSPHHDSNTRQTFKSKGVRIRRKTLLRSTYLQQYQKMKQQKQNQDKQKHEQSQQQQDDNEPHQIIQDGLTHYEQLKKRPKFLSFIKNRIRSVNMSPMNINPEQKRNNNNLTKQMKMDYAQIQKLSFTRQIGNSASPEKIIQKQYPKFFSRRNDISLPENVKKNQMCQKLIKQQQYIVSKTASISRQGRRKLQQRLAQIVLQMSSSNRHDPKKIKINKQRLLEIK